MNKSGQNAAINSSDVSERWQVKPLAELCVLFADGDWVESKDQSDNGIRLIQTGNVGEGLFKDRVEKARYISESTFKRLRCTEIFEGDCLVSRLPDPAGRSCILPDTGERMITAVDCTIIRFDSKQVIPEFFNYYTQSLAYLKDVDSETTGTTRRRISRGKLGEVKVPVPPLPVQHRIVAILDKAFEAIATAKANAEKNLKNARELFESYLNNIFSQKDKKWEQKTLKQVSAEFGRGKSKHRPRGDPKLLGGKYPLIQTGDIANSNHHLVEHSQTYNDIGLAQSKLWPKGTVCIAIVGANVAETAILDFDACFPDSVIGLVVNENLANNEYVEFLLQTFKVILKERGKGAARDNINLATFENQTFPFPNVAEQKRLVSCINNLHEQTQRLSSLYQQKLAALDELKKSILHQAFSGEL